MEGTEVGHKLSGAELRKQKLIEYLASKGRLKPPNPKPYLRGDLDPKTSRTIKRTHEKENYVSDVSTHKPGGPEIHAHTQKAKCLAKAKLPEKASGCAFAKRLPLTSSQNIASCVRNQSNVKGPPEAVTACVGVKGQSGPVRDRVVRRQPSKAQQPVLPARGKGASNKMQSEQNKQDSVSQPRRCSSLANKAPLYTSKPPPVCALRNLAASQTLQRKAELPKKPQQVLKTAQRTDNVGAVTRATVPNGCINPRPPQTRTSTSSRPSQLTSNTSKTPGQTLKSTSSTNCNAKPVKLQENFKKRTMSTTTLSHATTRAGGQAPKSKSSGQADSQAKNLSRGAKLQSSRLNDHQRPAALCRKSASSVVGKPVTAFGSRVSQASIPQSKPRPVAPSAGTQQEVAAPKISSSFSLPPSKSALRRRPTTAPASVTKIASLFVKSTDPPPGPENLKTPVTQSRPRMVVPATEPMTGAKKPTAAQAERLRKLQEWREAKGITYKRPPMPIQKSVRKSIAVPQHYWASMEEEDESQRLTYAVDRALSDCLELLQLGCPSEQVMGVLSRIPMGHKFCKYWMCRAQLMEREGNFEVLPLFEEAVRVVREPINDLRALVFEILKKRETQTNSAKDAQVEAEPLEAKEAAAKEEEEEKGNEDVPGTPKRVGVVIRTAKGGSSVVKYKITATPNGRGSQHQEPLRFNGQELRFFTPVRRSVRIERSAPRYPSALLEQDPCVASSHDLPPADTSPIYVYMENEALKDQVQVQLFQEDDEPDSEEIRCAITVDD